MSTPARLPNKAGWALDEALQEHDPAIACLLDDLIRHLEHEREAARSRYDKGTHTARGRAVDCNSVTTARGPAGDVAPAGKGESVRQVRKRGLSRQELTRCSLVRDSRDRL